MIQPFAPQLLDDGQGKTTCDLCNSRSFRTISALDRRGQPLDTVVCERCGLVSHGRIPSEAELDAFYAKDYRLEYHGELSPSDRRVMRAWKNGERVRDQLAPYLRGGDRVIEVGSGIGCTVKVFDLAGYDASGIEPNIGFCTYGAQKLHAAVRPAYLFDLPREPDYDLVLLIHVIEHFRSARQALEHIHTMLRPGGRLYVECPNLAGPFATYQRMFHFAHIFNFTPKTLTMLARSCGFEVERQFRNERQPNLQMLLVKTEQKELTIDRTSVQETLAALDRYNTLTYYLRWDKLRSRGVKIVRYTREWVEAKRFTRRCIEACQAGGKREVEVPRRRSAA